MWNLDFLYQKWCVEKDGQELHLNSKDVDVIILLSIAVELTDRPAPELSLETRKHSEAGKSILCESAVSADSSWLLVVHHRTLYS